MCPHCKSHNVELRKINPCFDIILYTYRCCECGEDFILQGVGMTIKDGRKFGKKKYRPETELLSKEFDQPIGGDYPNLEKGERYNPILDDPFYDGNTVKELRF